MINYRAIWFDMDGTIADLYSVENWLEFLRTENPNPYLTARPLIRLSALARRLNNLQRKGYTINIVSWTAKNSSRAYEQAVIKAKLAWLEKHLPSVKWDAIKILPYGTKKSSVGVGILFDDEINNREEWFAANVNSFAFDVNNILKVLEGLR